MFLEPNQTKRRYGRRFLRLKANKKGLLDVFTGSTALRKVSLKHLQVKVQEIWYKERI